MQDLQHKNKYNYLFLILGIAISIYVILRAYYIDITDDEAWSYFNVKHFWYVETLCSGNTHWFNFAAIKIALTLGLEQAWHLRWLSVLSGITFLGFIYYWIKNESHLYLKLFAFAFIFLNPFLLEYLSLARGYATGLCFLVASIYFLNKSIVNLNQRYWAFVALLLAGLSAIANFGFFYYFVGFCLFYLYHFYLKNGWLFLKDKTFYIDAFYVLGIAALVLRALLFIKVCSNDLSEFGGENFITSIFGSYIDTLLYKNISLHPTFKLALSYFIFILVAIAIVYGILKIKKHKNQLFHFTSIILLSMFLLLVINKWCLHVLYPIERTSLLFYPLLLLVLVNFLRTISEGNSIKKISVSIASMLLIINFSLNIKLVSGYDHSYNMNTKECFDYLKKIDTKKVGLPIELYFVYLKYYNVIGKPFDAESLIRYHYNKRWIKENKLEDFDYIMLAAPYDISYYKKSKLAFKGIHYFTKRQIVLLKVIKPS